MRDGRQEKTREAAGDNERVVLDSSSEGDTSLETSHSTLQITQKTTYMTCRPAPALAIPDVRDRQRVSVVVYSRNRFFRMFAS